MPETNANLSSSAIAIATLLGAIGNKILARCDVQEAPTGSAEALTIWSGHHVCLVALVPQLNIVVHTVPQQYFLVNSIPLTVSASRQTSL
jgi:hypothetical protein